MSRALLTLLTISFPKSPMKEDPGTFAVVGGGFTGLVAALRLAQAGHRVELFERGEVLGGLASGFELHGTSIERAYHHLFRTDTEILQLARELGVDARLHWHDSSLGVYCAGTLWSFMTPRDLLRFRPLSLIARVRAGLVAFYLQRQKRWRHLKKHTALKWMRSRAGREATAIIWEPLLRAKFSHFADSVSMAWLWARVHTRANSRGPRDTVEQLGYFDGGFDVLVQALRRELEREHVTVHHPALIEAIRGGERPSVRIAGEVREFSAVIATVPSHVFAALIANDPQVPASYRNQLAAIQYLGAICIVFSSRQDIGGQYWVSINEPGAPFVVFINHTKLVGTSNYDGYCVYYLGRYLPHDDAAFGLPDDDLHNSWFDYLQKIFPEFERDRVETCHVTRFRNAQHVVDRTYEERIPSYNTPARNVYLANFSQIFPEDRGTNFAVREGNRIAAMVCSKAPSRGSEAQFR